MFDIVMQIKRCLLFKNHKIVFSSANDFQFFPHYNKIQFISFILTGFENNFFVFWTFIVIIN